MPHRFPPAAALRAARVLPQALRARLRSEAAKGSYSSLDDGKTAAKKCLSEYDSGKNAAVFAFANGAYSKANDAAGKVNADTSAEDVEKAASELGLERLDITDDKGTVTACYPEGDKDKSIKEIKDIAIFNKVVKGISDKYMKDPEYNADKKSYYILAGVKKEDGGVSVNPEYILLSCEFAGENGVQSSDRHGTGEINKTPKENWPAEFKVDYVRCYQYKDLI